MHLAYCLHVAPPLGTRLLHGQKCGKEGTVEEEVGRMSNTAITGLSFQWVLLTWRFVSSGQTVNKRRTQPMKNRDIGAIWNPSLILTLNKKHRHNRERPGDRRHAESPTGPGAEPGTGPDTHSRYLNITIPHSASWQCASATCKICFPHNLISAAASCLSFSRPRRLDKRVVWRLGPDGHIGNAIPSPRVYTTRCASHATF